MIRFILYLPVLLFWSEHLQSQEVAGFRGKHWIGYYDLALSPAFIYAANSNDGFVTINGQNTISADYIYQMHKSLTFAAKYYRTNVLFNEPLKYTVKYKNSGSFYYNDLPYEEYLSPDTFAPLHAFELDFGIKNHRELLAPLGGYSVFELGFIFYKVKTSPNTFLADVEDEKYIVQKPNVTNKNLYKSLKLCYTWGKQWVIFDKVALNMGISTGWVLGGLGLKTSSFFDLDGNSSVAESDYIGLTSRYRLWGHNLLNFKLGIGYIVY